MMDTHALSTPVSPLFARIAGLRARFTAIALGCFVVCSGGWACTSTSPTTSDTVTDAGFADGTASDGTSSDVLDAGATDVTPGDSATSDGLASDAAQADTSTADVADGAASDAVTAADGSGGKATTWGAITGACGTVSAELKTSGPSFLVTTLAFKDAANFSPVGLSAGAKKRYEGENAGGSSICSEVMSMQVLHECEGAVLYKTETEIIYTSTQGAITDYETTMGGEKIGVSVTRAYKGPVINTYTDADATTLLKKKLAGVLESTAKVSPGDKWTKQILHIWTLRSDWVPVLKKAWDGIDAATKADTIVLVSIEIPPSGGKGWIVPDDCGVK